ncbi:MAG: YjdF family protein [Oscillospiraceae bacterium]|nr:YjdF family protein [Oscillospiraceae bacterium]
METAEIRLTVLFEDPFWVGLFERVCNGRYSVCKITFGAEPKDFAVYEYILSRWDTLEFSPALDCPPPDTRRVNPKRRQRLLQKQAGAGIGTKAQQALKLQQEQAKTDRKIRCRQRKEDEAARKFRIREEKRRDKHRGH